MKDEMPSKMAHLGLLFRALASVPRQMMGPFTNSGNSGERADLKEPSYRTG